MTQDNYKQEALCLSRHKFRKPSLISKPMIGIKSSILSCMMLAAFSNPAQAQSSLPAFTCDNSLYEVISGQLAVYDFPARDYSLIGPVAPVYNGLSYNTLDNYLYGFVQETGPLRGHLIRIGSNGAFESLGDVGITVPRGTFDNTNRLFISGNATRLNFIDVSTQTTGNITFTTPAGATPAVGNLLDFAYVRSGGQDLIIGAGNGSLSIFNLTTSQAESIAVPGLPSGGFGAAWGLADGRLYINENSSGDLYIIDDPAGSPSIVGILAATPSSQHDGAACFTSTDPNFLSPEADLSVTKTNTPGVNGDVDQANDSVTTGSTTTYTLTVQNNGLDPALGPLVRDTVGTGLTCTATDPVTITGNGVPSGSFTIGDLTSAGITLGELENGDAATLTYSCQVN